ncbi:MAG TPA: DNA polymerase III subunit delta [Acidimicrobiales bacterium]|nr:DNA polymerase III subunit delta [Acidimicrobiales bacterium]
MSATPVAPLVQLVKGDEPSLVRDKVIELVDGLVGDEDRSLLLEEVEVSAENKDDRAAQLAALVDAAQTPPFLTPRRIVVGRGLHSAKADELTGLTGVVAEPLPDVFIVLTWESGAVPKKFGDALKAGGGTVVDTSPGRNAKTWIGDHVEQSGLKLDGSARDLLVSHLGEDVGRLRGVIETLVSTFGPGAKLGADDISPYLGDEGAQAPWALTDAIDKGDIIAALDRLHRMMGAGERHALQIMASLHGHYARMLALDGLDVRGEKDAAAALGMRGSTFPARKALDQVRRLGHDKLAQAIALLARADRDLRGERAYPREVADDLVMEMLIARLANLSRSAR